MNPISIISKIPKSVYRIKQGIIHKINPDRCKYILVDKTPKVDVAQLKKISINIPDKADSFNIVTIGKRDDSKYTKEITTFYSGDRIIKRVIEGTDTPRIIRDYETKLSLKKMISRCRKVTQKIFNEETVQYETNLIEEQNTYLSPRTNNLKLQINKNVINGDKITATITEYPFIRHKNRKYLPNKVLGLDIEIKNDIPYITGTFETHNVKFTSDDDFLAYRFILDPVTKLRALTQYFIKKKNLEKLNINVVVSNNMDSNTAGYFDESILSILFNINSKNNLVNLAAHEVEHAYQYKQIGRLGKTRGYYRILSRNYYGKIDNLEDRNEAYKYLLASESYPKIRDGENFSNSEEYFNNYLEVNARKAAATAQAEYDKMGEVLSSQFFFGIK